MSLRVRFGLLFAVFLLLVSSSAAVTAWLVADQREAARVINLAGRQRMLVQQMSREALQIAARSDPAGHARTLDEAARTFDRTLAALLDGGQAPYLPGQAVDVPAAPGAVRPALETVRATWDGFRSQLETILAEPPGSLLFAEALNAVHRLTPVLAQQTDAVVQAYETESARAIARVRTIQVTFFFGAMGLLLAGLLLVRRQIIHPLGVLRQAARRIGQGDLDAPVRLGEQSEFAALADSLDTMRAQLKAARDELEGRVVQRTRELAALYDVIREIVSRLEIDHVLTSVTGKARDLLDSEVAFLCLLDEEKQTLALKAFDGPREAVCGTCVLVQRSVAGEILAHDGAMICPLGGCRTIAPRYQVSHLAAPLRVGGRVIGALCVGSSRPASYSTDQAVLLTELANTTAIALENARLFEQAERVAALEERQRIAAEMHDGLGQTLSYLQLKAGQLAGLIAVGEREAAARELAHISQALERSSHDVRQSIASLQAPPPRRPLQDELRDLVAAARGPTGMMTVETALHPEPLALHPDHSVQVLRVVQEALHNAHRHAGAEHVRVVLERDASRWRAIVEDNGCGFDPAVPAEKGHFGLSIMRARAARIGGTLDVESAPGRGTRVILSWPASAGEPVASS